MFEPVDVQDIMIAAMAGALVVMFGAMYAFAFAVAKLNGSRRVLFVAYGLFAGLTVNVLVLANALNMDGFWRFVSATMLLGYLLAPQAIWKLSVGTHEGSESKRANKKRVGV
jgi:hypothetical protein